MYNTRVFIVAEPERDVRNILTEYIKHIYPNAEIAIHPDIACAQSDAQRNPDIGAIIIGDGATVQDVNSFVQYVRCFLGIVTIPIIVFSNDLPDDTECEHLITLIPKPKIEEVIGLLRGRLCLDEPDELE